MNGSSKNGSGGRLRSEERFSILGDMPKFKDNPPTVGSKTSNNGSRRGGPGRHRRRRKASQAPSGPPPTPELHDPDARPSRRKRRRGRRGPKRGPDSAPQNQQNASAPTQRPRAGGGIDELELFCAYHLGIAEDGKYHTSNIHDVARRFGLSAGGIREALSAHGMDSETVINSDFDMAMAQYDIQVAPEGLNLVELGKNLFREFREASSNVRNWEQELAEDAAANAKTFGPTDD